MSIGNLSLIKSQKKDSLTSLLKYSLGYIDIYKKILSKSNPNGVDNALYKTHLGSLANRRRLSRLEKAIVNIDKKEIEAETILNTSLERATRLRDESANNNKFQIGSIVRFEQQLETQKAVVKAVIDEGADTIQFVKDKLQVRIPEEYLDWTNINLQPAYTKPDLAITPRVQHQEKWQRVIEEIHREKTVASDLEASEIIRDLEFLSEQVCIRLINEISRERTFMKARFKYIRTSTEYRELAKIEGFLTEKLGNGSSLLELEGHFKELNSRIDES
jgi:hypothetical protein